MSSVPWVAFFLWVLDWVYNLSFSCYLSLWKDGRSWWPFLLPQRLRSVTKGFYSLGFSQGLSRPVYLPSQATLPQTVGYLWEFSESLDSITFLHSTHIESDDARNFLCIPEYRFFSWLPFWNSMVQGSTFSLLWLPLVTFCWFVPFFKKFFYFLLYFIEYTKRVYVFVPLRWFHPDVHIILMIRKKCYKTFKLKQRSFGYL